MKHLNLLAKTTEKKSAAFWWLLPVMELADFEETLSHLTRPEVAHYVVSVTKELAELLGISLVEGRGESED